MKQLFTLCIFVLAVNVALAQQPIYEVTAGVGNGVRFWQSDSYKIHMGNANEYQFGPVNDYSIKMNMDATPGRGWTWGIQGAKPVAAIGSNGNMQISGTFKSAQLEVAGIGGSNVDLTVSGRIRSTSTDGGLWFGNNDGFIGLNGQYLGLWTPGVGWNAFQIHKSTGNIGIGIQDPVFRLDVNGTIGVGGVAVVNTSNNVNDIYINSRVIRNESTVNTDGMFVNFDSNGGANAHLRFYANGRAERMRIDASSGNVGIGTSSPGVRLVVQGQGGGNTDLAVNGRIVTGDASNMGGVLLAGPGNMFMGQVSATSMGWYNNGEWRMVSDNNGNVGIGTTTPNQKLTVKGTIYGKEIKVDLAVPGPDYVFAKDYILPSLDSVQSYINQNQHLPEVPSAKEMEVNGINLSEMNILLLKKVEELTLYVIELKRRDELQQRQIEQLEKKK